MNETVATIPIGALLAPILAALLIQVTKTWPQASGSILTIAGGAIGGASALVIALNAGDQAAASIAVNTIIGALLPHYAHKLILKNTPVGAALKGFGAAVPAAFASVSTAVRAQSKDEVLADLRAKLARLNLPPTEQVLRALSAGKVITAQELEAGLAALHA